MKKVLHILLLFSLSFSLFGQEEQQCEDSTATSREEKITLLPSAYYMPETRLAFGTFFFVPFRVCKTDTLSRSSNFENWITYTLNKQFSIENDWTIFSEYERYMFNGMLSYTRFPEYNFGIGNDTRTEDRKGIIFSLLSLNSKNFKQINKKYFVGLNYKMQYMRDVNTTDGTEFLLPGSEGYFINCLGPIFLYDTRDNVLNCKQGTYLETSVAYNADFLKGRYNALNYFVDLRKYYPFLEGRIRPSTFVWNAYLNFNHGELPFRALPHIGGGRYLRGYYTGRFRDMNMLSYQIETRIPLFWRIGAAAFSGVAQVAHQVQDFSWSGFKYSWGGGLRFIVNKEANANLRLDLGITPEGTGLYIIFAEAF